MDVFDPRLRTSKKEKKEDIKKVNKKLKENPLVNILFDTTPEIILILNKYRQIVMSNSNLLHFLKVEKEDVLLGKRPGEALSCIRCASKNIGCGSTRFCKYCGAINAIFNSQKFKAKDIQECNITVRRKTGIRGFNFLIWASPFEFEGEDYTIFVARDISVEKFQDVFERMVFHEILDLAGSIKSLMELLPHMVQEKIKEFKEEGVKIASQLISQIESHKDLLLAERGELEVKAETIYVPDLLSAITVLYRSHKLCEGKFINVSINAELLYICSDQIILSRCLGHLIKNALEASRPGDTITVSYENDSDGIKFMVHNRGEMSEEVQCQLFNRGFSTKKERGRGLGTYSIKLLVERYLNGKVNFTSDEKEGTSFIVRL